ncbi:C-type lectin domain family 2 member H-like [Cricetulus griseus]|uniref:C-type lectin domain family 2 member H-like n=1 Tax=Cricetulus griseus TaxID=10029 RepID=A0A9J7GG72_CRIGR|nr:C-type lectin domain family 2 member H-like [Cricetulus griseus]XP_027285767.1 C-type lectin domain family 2 member H-like [Cricetulus griseus]
MSAVKIEEASMGLLTPDLITTDSLQDVEIGKKLQGKCLRIIFTESPVKLYCCYGVIMVLSAAVISLSVALSSSEKKENMETCDCYATCPRDWIGLGSKCFYFSEDMRNWAFSQTACLELEAHLAVFESLEELNFLRRYKGASDHWIGLHRESSEHTWMWTDNTEYNNLVPIRGKGECGYLSDMGISSAREHAPRKWICSKFNKHVSQVQRF